MPPATPSPPRPARRLFRRPKLLAGVFAVSVVAGGAGMAAWMYAVRPGMAEVEAHLVHTPPQAGGLAATWFGTTAVLLSDGDQSLFVDPFFTRPGGWGKVSRNAEIAPDEERIARGLSAARLRNLAAVLVSHSHYDHAMDAGVVARLSGAVLAGSESTANIGRGAGLPEAQLRVMRSGQPQVFGPYTVTFVQSRHAGATGGRPTGDIEQPLAPPARFGDYRQGGTYSILVEHAAGSVLLHGSAGFAAGALAGRRADIVFLGIALRGELEPYLAETVDAVGATRLVPTHWDDFTRTLDRPLKPMPFGVKLDAFFREAAGLRPRLRIQTLAPGEAVGLFPPPG